MNPTPESRALANVLSNTFGGNGLSTNKQVEMAAELIEEHVAERIHDYDLRHKPLRATETPEIPL
jgi:hypothetical protein